VTQLATKSESPCGRHVSFFLTTPRARPWEWCAHARAHGCSCVRVWTLPSLRRKLSLYCPSRMGAIRPQPSFQKSEQAGGRCSAYSCGALSSKTNGSHLLDPFRTTSPGVLQKIWCISQAVPFATINAHISQRLRGAARPSSPRETGAPLAYRCTSSGASCPRRVVQRPRPAVRETASPRDN
jgi:hypothetical protein